MAKVHRIHSMTDDAPWAGGLPPQGSPEHPRTIRALDGVLRHAGVPGFVIGHVGPTMTLAGRLPAVEEVIDDPGVTAGVEIAPGCDLRRDTCVGRFGNLLNFGGFPDIPGRNPFGGGSII